MNIRDFFRSHAFTAILCSLLALLVLLLIFQAGVYVGYRKASFAYNWNQNYFRGFDDPRSIFAPFANDPDDPSPHGAVGSIVSVHLPLVMVQGNGSSEEVVSVESDTAIRRLHQSATTSDLAAGEQVIVIGEPGDNGQIDASMIRILPPMGTSTPPAAAGSTTGSGQSYQ